MTPPDQGNVLNPPIDSGLSTDSDRVQKWKWWERIFEFVRKHPLLLAFLAIGIFVGVYFLSRSQTNLVTGQALAKVVRGNLEVVVLEGGNVKALESLELKSQVETREGAKILSIVDEGYEVTPADVEAKKVLIKLDPTEMKEKIEQHDIEFENAQSALTETDEARSIQKTESENEIKVARQTARFALLDFEKYLGEGTSRKVLALRELPADESALIAYEEKFRERLLKMTGKDKKKPEETKEKETPDEKETEKESKEGESSSEDAEDEIIDRGKWVSIDFTQYLEEELLGDGEAQQELRKREDELLVAQSEHAVEMEEVLGSERLAKNDFITKATLEKQKVALKKAEIKELSAETGLELYRRYEYPKKAEELLTKYEDSLHLLDLKKKEAIAKLSQAEAKFKSAEQMFKMANKKRDELAGQLESCTIVATKPGLVVYGSSERNPYYSSEEKIEEGASVRYKKTIITIPDMTRMGVKVSVQESHIKKVKEDQKVRIVADAETDKTLTGVVKKVAVLPDSNRWYDNPNQKVYPTEIHIDGTHDWLKPGMSSKVEIIVEELDDILKIPLQSVMIDEGDTIVYVDRGGQAVRTEVETGSFTDEFIEITGGLEEGQMVYLNKPKFGEASAETTGDSSN